MDKKKNSRTCRNPVPTVDVIIEIKNATRKDGIVLIRRKNPPYGWALPGGFVEYGESLEKAAVREAEEETSLRIELRYQLHTYSEPDRDSRQHTISTVFVARAAGAPKARNDARDIRIFSREEIDFPLAFDHEKILADYYARQEPVKGRAFGSPLARSLYPRASTAEVDPRAKPGAPAAEKGTAPGVRRKRRI